MMTHFIIISLVACAVLYLRGMATELEKKAAVNHTPTYWIETDLEPDDLLALLLLPRPRYVVAGEGNALVKDERAKKYYKMLYPSEQPRFIQGLGSDRVFPEDGQEFAVNEPVLCIGPLSCSYNPEMYMESFREFATSENPVMLSFKPMRELFDLYLHNARVADMLENVTLYAYGGFNFRSLLSREVDRREDLVRFLGAFRRAIIYESFHATGEQNSVNRHTAPELFAVLQAVATHGYVRTMLRYGEMWNRHLANEMENRCGERARKIVESIRDNESFQFLAADFMLAALMIGGVKPTKAVRFHIDEHGYTHFENAGISDVSQLYMYAGFSLDKVLRRWVYPVLKKRLEIV